MPWSVPAATRRADRRRLARKDERDDQAMVINMLDDLRRANRIASQRGRGPGRVGLCLGAACVLLVLEPVPPDAECDAPEPAARSCPATRTGARRRGWLGSGVVARGRAVEHHRQRLAAAVLRVCVEERGPILDARHALRAVHGRPPGRRNTLTLFRVRSGGSQRMASCRVGSRCSARARTIAHRLQTCPAAQVSVTVCGHG